MQGFSIFILIFCDMFRRFFVPNSIHVVLLTEMNSHLIANCEIVSPCVKIKDKPKMFQHQTSKTM